MGEDKFREYYSFAFVRNPYDLLVSLYFYLRQDINHKENEAVMKMSFDEFARWRISLNAPTQFQILSCPDSGELLPTYIGRFESLGSDLRHIASEVGVSMKDVPNNNQSNFRKKKDYSEYYDDELRRVVGEHFRKDLDVFGYSFDEFASGENAE